MLSRAQAILAGFSSEHRGFGTEKFLWNFSAQQLRVRARNGLDISCAVFADLLESVSKLAGSLSSPMLHQKEKARLCRAFSFGGDEITVEPCKLRSEDGKIGEQQK